MYIIRTLQVTETSSAETLTTMRQITTGQTFIACNGAKNVLHSF